MADVIDMKERQKRGACECCNESIVKMLREMLADAEAGKIVQFAAVYSHSDNKIRDCWADGGFSPHAIIGGLEFLKATLIANEVVERKFE